MQKRKKIGNKSISHTIPAEIIGKCEEFENWKIFEKKNQI